MDLFVEVPVDWFEKDEEERSIEFINIEKEVDPNSLDLVVEVPVNWFESPDTYFPMGWF